MRRKPTRTMHRELDESIAALRCSNRITACVERENEMTRPINHAFIDQSFFFSAVVTIECPRIASR